MTYRLQRPAAAGAEGHDERGRAAHPARTAAGSQARRRRTRRAAVRAAGRHVGDDEGQTVIDPDEEVQAAIADLFSAFERTGSAYGVVGAFTDRRVPQPASSGPRAGAPRGGARTRPPG